MRTLFKIFSFITVISLGSSLAGADDAFDVWLRLQSSSQQREIVPVLAKGTNKPITFGAEKEGTTAKLTHVYGPKSDFFYRKVSILQPEEKKIFLVNFLQGLKDRTHLFGDVYDINGNQKSLNLDFLASQDIPNLPTPNLLYLFNEFLDQTNDKSFSFLHQGVRSRLFYGTFPGLDKTTRIHPGRDSRSMKDSVYANEWAPLYGDPEKYILSVVGQFTQEGWEILTVPQKSYGEFLRLGDWFQVRMGSDDKLFPKFGHNWIVTENSSELLAKKIEIAQLLNYVQIYIILESLRVKNGIENSGQKQPHPVQSLESLQTDRGTIRLESGRFGDSLAVEVRAGMKNAEIQEFVLETIVSHFSTLDFTSLSDLPLWYPNFRPGISEISKRFGVDIIQAKNLMKKIATVQKDSTKSEIRRFTMPDVYLTPLWNWENAPFISAEKKAQLKNLGRAYINEMISNDQLDSQKVRTMLSAWVTEVNLTTEIKATLTPKSKVSPKVVPRTRVKDSANSKKICTQIF